MKSFKDCELFKHLSSEELSTVKERGESTEYNEGDVIFERSDPGNYFYVILDGLVQITVPDPLSDRNKTLALLEPSDILGEMSILTGNERSAKATAVRDTRLFKIEKDEFIDLLHDFPQIGINLSRILSGRLWDTDTEIQTMAFKTLRGRLASHLIKLGNLFGRETEDGTLIEVELTHKMLADIVGTHRETVTRNLNELEEKDIITSEDGKVTVKKWSRLEGMT